MPAKAEVTITVETVPGATPIKLTLAEARRLRDELDHAISSVTVQSRFLPLSQFDR